MENTVEESPKVDVSAFDEIYPERTLIREVSVINYDDNGNKTICKKSYSKYILNNKEHIETEKHTHILNKEGKLLYWKNHNTVHEYLREYHDNGKAKLELSNGYILREFNKDEKIIHYKNLRDATNLNEYWVEYNDEGKCTHIRHANGYEAWY